MKNENETRTRKDGKMARPKEAVRGSGNFARTKHVHDSRDMHIVARGYDGWTRLAGIIIGIAFGIMFALGIIAW